MNLQGTLSSIFCAMVCIILILTGGCKKSVDADPDPTGALQQYAGCKQFLSDKSRQADNYVPGQHEDCIEYQYNGTDTLVLRHINASFNCCPGDISAEIDFNGSQITIDENELEQGCRCQCLFDLEYEVVNLVPGVYTLHIIEPYLEGSDQILEFTLELSSATTGSHCLPRSNYPWTQQQ
jgi:hypothetical protein